MVSDDVENGVGRVRAFVRACMCVCVNERVVRIVSCFNGVERLRFDVSSHTLSCACVRVCVRAVELLDPCLPTVLQNGGGGGHLYCFELLCARVRFIGLVDLSSERMPLCNVGTLVSVFYCLYRELRRLFWGKCTSKTPSPGG